MKIMMVKQLNGSLLPAHDSDYEKLKKIKLNKMVEVEITQKRNLKFLRKFFALINLVYQNQDHYNNIDHLRYDLTIESGFYNVRYNKFTGEEIIEPKSISFSSMDEVEFSDLYNKFLTTVVRVFGWDGEDIESNLSEFM